MRISTTLFFDQSIYNIQDQQKEIFDLQRKISTGKEIIYASDSPVAMAQLVKLYDENRKTDSQNGSIAVAERENRLEESVFTNFIDGLQRLRELTLQAHNGSMSANDFKNIATEADQILQQLVQFANTKSATGEYVFSGYQTMQQTVNADSTGRYQYNGDDGQRFVQIGSDTQIAVTDSGRELFFKIPASSNSFQTRADSNNTGSGMIGVGQVTNATTWQSSVPATYSIVFNTPSTTFDVVDDSNPTVPLAGLNNLAYTNGMQVTIQGITVTLSGTPNPGDVFHLEPPVNQDIFTTVQIFKDALNSATSLDTNLEFVFNETLSNLDSAMNVLNINRSEVGARLNTIEAQKDVNDSFKVWTTEAISNIEDLDFVKAVSDFSLYQTTFEAAQKTFLRVQNLSLFEMMR